MIKIAKRNTPTATGAAIAAILRWFCGDWVGAGLDSGVDELPSAGVEVLLVDWLVLVLVLKVEEGGNEVESESESRELLFLDAELCLEDEGDLLVEAGEIEDDVVGVLEELGELEVVGMGGAIEADDDKGCELDDGTIEDEKVPAMGDAVWVSDIVADVVAGTEIDLSPSDGPGEASVGESTELGIAGPSGVVFVPPLTSGISLTIPPDISDAGSIGSRMISGGGRPYIATVGCLKRKKVLTTSRFPRSIIISVTGIMDTNSHGIEE